MIDCGYGRCGEPATKIMAFEAAAVACMHVAGYCDEHAGLVAESMGAVPAAGPALSQEARAIEGV